MTTDQLLLILFFSLALGVSFLCSLMEATILSVSRSYAMSLREQGRKAGHLLVKLLEQIDRPLAAILTLNTIANTLGAAGVGAQAQVVFGHAWVTAVSIVLTFLILIFSEIVPKTLGATYSRNIAGPAAYIVTGMIFVSWPLVKMLQAVSALLRPRSARQQYTREELSYIMEIGHLEGVLKPREMALIKNLLELDDIATKEVMTPRTVVFMLPRELTAEESRQRCEKSGHSRIPVFDGDPDHILGIVLRRDIYDAVYSGESDRVIGDMIRPMHVVPEVAPLDNVIWQFITRREHMFLVVDEYGGTAGIVTLEDALETIFGMEIVDETDRVVDMQRHARQVARWGITGLAPADKRLGKG